LGTGATARVYQARDPASGDEVAIKLLHPHLAGTAGLRTRFEREARASQALDHPGIVQVVDHGYQGDQAYLVMEYVPGPSLRTYLQERGGPLEVEPAIRLAAALAEALDYAHSQGVIHRDIKPSNIVLCHGRLDQPVIGDFGLARLAEATLQTASGGTAGTPAYISPEQGQGRPADARSDVYALGAVLFELLTGRPPFEAESPYAVVLHHVHTPPPDPRDLRPGLPRAVADVVLRALAKDPGDRYASAGEFAQACDAAPPTAPDTRRPSRPALVLVAAATLLVVLTGILLLAWSQGWLPGGRPGAAAANATPAVEHLVLQGPPAVREAWLDPDLPQRIASEDPKVHLQGPSTPDRIACRLALPEMPAGSQVVSATLSLYTVPWGEDNRYATIAAHRLLRDWDPGTANYTSPWATPGLQAGVDYEAEPFLTLALDDRLQAEGWLEIDVTAPVGDWLAGQANHGFVLRMTDDSFGMAHLWVYTGLYEDPDLRPRLNLLYRRP
jgi:hypothetical protein